MRSEKSVRKKFEKGLRDQDGIAPQSAENAEARSKFPARLRALCASAVNLFFDQGPRNCDATLM